MSYSLINTSSLPGDNMDPDGIESAARSLRSVGKKVSHQGAVTLQTWHGLSASYHAPEQGTLFSAMNPAKATAEMFGTEMGTAATALETFAEEVRTIKAAVATIKTEADAFVDKINANGGMVPGNGGAGYNPYATNGGATLDVHWYEDAATVNTNNGFRDRLDHQQEALWAAERTCANAIGAIYCAAPIGPITSQSNGVGYGVDDIPDDAQMPWGAAVKRKESCAEKVVNGVVVDGLVGGIVLPLTGFVGFNISIENGYQGWSLGNIGNSFVGLGNFAIGGFATSPLGLPLLAMPGAAGDFFRDRAKSATYGVIGLAGIDMYADDPFHKWKDDPWRTGGSSVFNVGSLFIPGGAATKAGKVAEVGTDAARVSELAADASKASLASKAAKAAELARDALQSAKGITADAFNSLFKGSDLDGAIRFGHDLDVEIPTAPRDHVDVGDTNVGHGDSGDAPAPRDYTDDSAPAPRPDDGADATPTRDSADSGTNPAHDPADPGTSPAHDPAASTAHDPATSTAHDPADAGSTPHDGTGDPAQQTDPLTGDPQTGDPQHAQPQNSGHTSTPADHTPVNDPNLPKADPVVKAQVDQIRADINHDLQTQADNAWQAAKNREAVELTPYGKTATPQQLGSWAHKELADWIRGHADQLVDPNSGYRIREEASFDRAGRPTDHAASGSIRPDIVIERKLPSGRYEVVHVIDLKTGRASIGQRWETAVQSRLKPLYASEALRPHKIAPIQPPTPVGAR